MEKPLYQPWSEEAFRSSIYVQSMTYIQKWMYKSLLLASFCEATRPYLPNDDNVLWRLAGCESKKQWDEHKAPILERFEKVNSDGVALLLNDRVYQDWLKVQDYYSNRSENGRKSAEKRWGGGSVMGPLQPVITSDNKEVKEVNIKKLSKGQYTETKIAAIWRETTGQVLAEPKDNFKKDLKELVRVYGEEQILSQFEIWASLNSSGGFKRPVSAFIKQYSGTASATRNLFKPNEINDLAVELSLCSGGDVTFNRLNLNSLAQLLTEFSQTDIISGFKKFYSEYTGDWQWAAKDFIEKAPQIILVARKQKEEQIRKTEEIERLKQQVQSENASKWGVVEAQKAVDERLAEEALQTLTGEFDGLKNESGGIEEEFFGPAAVFAADKTF